MTQEEIAAELDLLLAEKRHTLGLTDENMRVQASRNLLADALIFVADLLGNDVMSLAYGDATTEDRSTHLGLLAMRTNLVSHLFLRMPNDAADFNAVTREALAVIRGDTPQLFERFPVRKTKYRVHGAKLTALQWDAWLDGQALSPGDRHHQIAEAYGETWDVIDGWKGPIAKLFGERSVYDRLTAERRDGARNLRRLTMLTGETWEDALVRDGLAYRGALKANA